MFRNIGETHTHSMKDGSIAFMNLRPNPLCGSEYLLPFTWLEDEAKAVGKVRNNRALDKRSSETEVSDCSSDKANFSYQSHRPVNFNPGIATVLNSHNGAPVFWIF
jgi:hypothetical protein